jgi:hypothetical protein
MLSLFLSIKHVSELASSVLRSLQIKERLITSGAAHSSDRKQYLSILFYALPGITHALNINFTN